MTIRVIIRLAALAIIGLLPLFACGDDDDEPTDNTIALADWVAEFDRICVEFIGSVGPDTSDEEFGERSAAALAEMRALGQPAEQAAAAATMLESIERTTLNDDVTEEEAAALDARFLEAAEVVGVSDECIGGPAG